MDWGSDRSWAEASRADSQVLYVAGVGVALASEVCCHWSQDLGGPFRQGPSRLRRGGAARHGPGVRPLQVLRTGVLRLSSGSQLIQCNEFLSLQCSPTFTYHQVSSHLGKCLLPWERGGQEYKFQTIAKFIPSFRKMACFFLTVSQGKQYGLLLDTQ